MGEYGRGVLSAVVADTMPVAVNLIKNWWEWKQCLCAREMQQMLEQYECLVTKRRGNDRSGCADQEL